MRQQRFTKKYIKKNGVDAHRRERTRESEREEEIGRGRTKKDRKKLYR